MAFYFFTESNALLDQTSVTEAFGPQEVSVSGGGTSSSTHFQVTSIHKATKNPFAYCICDGLIRYQQDETNPDLLNAILRPGKRVVPGVPILYFVYRGIIKSSITSNAAGDLIPAVSLPLSANSEYITDRVRFYQEKQNHRYGTNTIPNINQLGLAFSSGATPPFDRTDEASIKSIFFENTSLKPIPATGGSILGRFHKDFFGLEIVLDSLMEEPTLHIVRKVSLQANAANVNLPGNIIVATALTNAANKPIRERILQYLDPAAFFGMHYHEGLILKQEGSVVTSPTKEAAFVNGVFKKFLNRNTVYLDIRNENGLSFNYYNSPYEQILLSTDETNLNKKSQDNMALRFATTITPVNVETHGWPIKIIKANEFSFKPDSKQTGIRIAFTIGEVITATTQRIVYLNHGSFYYNAANVQRTPERDLQQRFSDLITKGTSGTDLYTPDLILTSVAAKFSESGIDVLRPVGSYHKVMYVKQHAPAGSVSSSKVQTFKNFDNLFAVKRIDNYYRWVSGGITSQYCLTAQEKYVFDADGAIEGVVQTGFAFDVKGTAQNEKRVTFFHTLVAEKSPGAIPSKTKDLIESILLSTPATPVQYETFFSNYHSGYKDGAMLDLILTKKVIDKEPDSATPTSRVFLKYNQNKGDKKNKAYTENAVKAISFTLEEYEKIIQLRDSNSYDSGYHPVFLQQQTLTSLDSTDSAVAHKLLTLKIAGFEKQGNNYVAKTNDIPSADVELQSLDWNLFVTQPAGLFEPTPIDMKHAGFEFIGSNGTASPGFPAEERQFQRALEDIKKYNPEFYGSLQRAFIFGTKVYFHDKPGVAAFQRPVIYIEIRNIPNLGGQTGLTRMGGFPSLAPTVKEGRYTAKFPGVNVEMPSDHPNRIMLAGTEKPFREAFLKNPPDGVEPPRDRFINVKHYRDLNINNSLNPSEIDKLFKPTIQVVKLAEEFVPAFLKGTDYDIKYDNYPYVSYEQAMMLGFASHNGNIFIQLDDDFATASDTPYPDCSFFSSLRFSLAKILSHELGHALSQIENPLRAYIWDEIEMFFNGRSDHTQIYQSGNDNNPLNKIPDEISINPTVNPTNFTKNGVSTLAVQGTFTGDSTYDTELNLVALKFKSKFGDGHLRGNLTGSYSALSDTITMLNYSIAVNDELIKNKGTKQPQLTPKAGYLYYNLDLRIYYNGAPIPTNIVNEYLGLTQYSK